MTIRKILIASDFNFNCLGASYERGFRALGHKVARFDITKNFKLLEWPLKNRILHRLTINSLNLRRHCAKVYNQKLIDQTVDSESEWLLLHNGDFVMPETIRVIQSRGIRVAIFHADNPLPPNYNNRPETLEVARVVDLYLTWSKKLVKELSNLGAKRAEFLPFGWDEEVFPFQDGMQQGTWPGVIFIGGWDREREAFLEQLSSHVPLKIHGPAYWGSRTRPNSRVRTCWSGQSLVASKAAYAIRESAICLNILRTQHTVSGQPDGVIMRHFEVPGSGGFLLSTRSSTATELFKDEIEGAYFTGVDECITKCRYYLEADNERKMIADRAHSIVSERYTYKDCAEKIIGYMKEIEAGVL